MDATANALLELRKQIEANKKLLEEQENALSVLEKMMGVSGKKETESVSHVQTQKPIINVIDLSSIGHNVGEKKETLREQVGNVIKRFGAQEFVSAHVMGALEKDGVKVNGLYPKSRVAMVLSKLEESGEIVRTYTGAGQVPHRYTRKLTEKDF